MSIDQQKMLFLQSPLDLRGGEMNLQDNSVNQSLPDFLSDGPILSGRETEGQESSMDESDRVINILLFKLRKF